MLLVRVAWPVMMCAGLAMSGPGCGLLRKRPVKRDDSHVREMLDGRRPIGQIAMLDREHEFVLIRSPLPESLKEKTMLVARDAAGSTTGKLKVSPEKKRTFLAADITEGSPKMGDVVFVPSDAKLTSTAPPPDAAKPPSRMAIDISSVPPPASAIPSAADESLPPLGQPSGPAEAIPELPEGGEPPQ
jgi:hypothetical protein